MFRKKTPATSPKPPADGVSITDAGPCQKSLRLHVGLDAILPIRSLIIGEFQKQATLHGFRKGKAPAELVEQQYAKSIQEETLHRVTKQTFERIVKDHDLRPIGPFELSRADFHQTDGFTLEATVEVEPSFVLGRYTGIVLKRPADEVTPDEVARGLASLQDSMAQLEPAGQEGQAKERKVPALDDEFAKDVGFQTLAELRTHVESKLREQKRAAQRQTIESALCTELLNRHAFDVPPKLVSHQTERLTRDFKARLLLSGVPEAQLEEQTAQFAAQLRQGAERHVKLGFILDRIAEQESVSVAQDEIVARLWQLSQRWKKDPAEVRKLFDAQGLWPSVVSTIRQEKTIAWLLAASTIEEASPIVTATSSSSS